MRLDKEVLHEVVLQFLRDGWQVVSLPKRYVGVSTSWHLRPYYQNVHAIGDYANSVVLDAFEAALRDDNVTLLRPRLEHAQLLREEDMIRVGRLGGASAVSRL